MLPRFVSPKKLANLVPPDSYAPLEGPLIGSGSSATLINEVHVLVLDVACQALSLSECALQKRVGTMQLPRDVPNPF